MPRIIALLSALTLPAASCWAQDLLDDRWFLTPQIGVIFSDKSDFDNGWGLGASLGRPYNSRIAYEFSLYGQKLDTDNAGDYERISLSGQGLWFPFSSPFRDSGVFSPYLLGGLQVARIDFLGEDLNAWGPVAGLGFIRKFDRFRLRLELRYQLDEVNGKGVVQDDTFYTWFASAGVQIPLGAKPQPPAPPVTAAPPLPPEPQVVTEVKTIRMEILFPVNSDEIRPEYRSEVEKVAEFLRQHPRATVVIEGHTDSTGNADYNKQLSQRRADAVKVELISRYGIGSKRLTAYGYGQERPIADNTTADGRSANRRVVAVIRTEVDRVIEP